MPFLHFLKSIDKTKEGSGVRALQLLRRDWSPFLVHFTSWEAMAKLREWYETHNDSTSELSDWIKDQLSTADEKSLAAFETICTGQGTSGKKGVRGLLANRPGGMSIYEECVCLTECTIPGLIALSEIYGRFGFVFRKDKIYKLGGRPCAYVDPKHYEVLKKLNNNILSGPQFSLYNKLDLESKDGKRLDFTHDREWRIFTDLEFKKCPPEFALCPSNFLEKVKKALPDTHVIPLDILYEWGA